MFKNDKENLSIEYAHLERPRIKAFMEIGIRSPLFTIVAPTGYGKTYEAKSFFENSTVRFAWLRITQLDNLSSHFWKNLLLSLYEGFPRMREQLEILDFPNTLAKLDSFVRIFAEEIYNGPFMVFVIDEYETLQNEEIKLLFRYLLEANLENFCLTIISQKNTDLSLEPAERGREAFQIDGRDLKFTFEEIRDFFENQGIKLSEVLLSKITADTGGWPLMVYLLSLQLKVNPNSYQESRGLSMERVKAFFENDFFDNYPEDIKQLLIKLSFTPSFNLDMVNLIGNVVEDVFLNVLKNNIFISYDDSISYYVFQNTYREFLLEKRTFISEEERARVFEIAGDCAVKSQSLLNAVDYYSQTQNYNKMLNTIINFLGSNFAISNAHNDFFTKKMDALPKEAQDNNYLASYVKVVLNMQEFQLQKALDILTNMETKLLQETSKEASLMLGEVYEMMANIHMMLHRVCAMDYYEKAAQYLPKGSNFKHKNMLRFKNFSIFSIEDYTPGAVERMEKALHDKIDAINQVEKGSASGFHYLYSTEAAYYRHDLDKAKEMAFKTLEESLKVSQHDIICDAYFILAKTECMRGNYSGVLENVKKIKEYINEAQILEMKEVANYVSNWLDFTFSNSNKTLSWLPSAKPDVALMTPLIMGREELLYAIYLAQNEKHVELIAYLEQIKSLYRIKGWGDSLSADIMLAVTYLKLNDKERSLKILWETYNMTYHNGIITPFIEGGSSMRTLIDYARQSQYNFDESWLDNIHRKSSAYAKRLSAMIKEHEKNSAPIESSKITLSKRESEVLYSISQGLTRNEIADLYGISVNTVKTTTTNLYNKLGAINRADAIRKASSAGFIS